MYSALCIHAPVSQMEVGTVDMTDGLSAPPAPPTQPAPCVSGGVTGHDARLIGPPVPPSPSAPCASGGVSESLGDVTGSLSALASQANAALSETEGSLSKSLQVGWWGEREGGRDEGGRRQGVGCVWGVCCRRGRGKKGAGGGGGGEQDDAAGGRRAYRSTAVLQYRQPT